MEERLIVNRYQSALDDLKGVWGGKVNGEISNYDILGRAIDVMQEMKKEIEELQNETI